MIGWGSFSYAFGPLMAFLVLGLLILILRWAFARGGSVVERPSRPSSADDYGMLVPVARPSTYAEGEVLRRTLEESQVRATLAFTVDGPRLMVWPEDEAAARAVLRTRRAR